MGYYVYIEESTLALPKEYYDQAYSVLCDLNKYDDYKQGGSFGGPGKDIKWFSWMAEDYPSECSNAQEILEMLGFACVEEDNALTIHQYDSKIGQEDLFLSTICPLLNGYIVWRGEDGEEWMDNYDGMTVKRYYRSSDWVSSVDYDGPIEYYKRMAELRKESRLRLKQEQEKNEATKGA